MALYQDATPAEALHNDGLKLFEKGSFDEAIAAVTESLRLHTAGQKKEEQAINLRLLALIHDGIGERQKSLEFYGRALGLAREVKNRSLEARTLRDLGVLHYNLDDNDRAFQYLDQALVIQRKDSKPGALALTLFGLGELRRYRGNLVEARKLFEEALPLAREGKERACEADLLSSLAMVDMKEAKLAASRQRLEEAMPIREELKDLRGEGSTRLKLGFLLERQGDFAGALVAMRRAVELYEAAKYQGGEAFGRQALAIVARRSGDLGEANAQMLRAVGIAEGLRQRLSDRDLRATYIGYVQNRYEFLIETLLEQDRGNARRAFEMSERARARALLEELRDAGVKNATDAAPSMNLEQIQRKVLDADTTLLEYSLGDQKSHVFVVTATSIQHRELPGRVVLEGMARKAYEAYRQAGPLPEASALRKLLIGTVKAKRLVVVADGALQYLPFADLCPEATVVIAPSASAIGVLRGLPKRPLPQRKIAVFADPDAPQLSRLPFARMEAESILAMVPEARRSLALGPLATRKAVLASQAEILHFAAHSTLDTERPEKTEIVLSGGSLRLRDIYSMKVDATLVVLSACQTALGKSMKREGLIGLTRAFQEAGVERVVASLWKVDDRATAELMKRFYEAMLRGGRTAAEALRQAQQSLAGTKRWSHPFYWAGFVLEGEWR